MNVIKEIDLKGLAKELNIKLSSDTIQQMEQATSYQVFSSLRNAEIKKHLSQNLNNLEVVSQPKEIVPQPQPERIIFWVGLLGASLLTICGLLTKLKLNWRKK